MLDNPLALLGLLLIALLVIGINASLVGALRGRGGGDSGLGRMLTGLNDARKSRQAEADRYAELSRLVAELQARDHPEKPEGHGE